MKKNLLSAMKASALVYFKASSKTKVQTYSSRAFPAGMELKKRNVLLDICSSRRLTTGRTASLTRSIRGSEGGESFWVLA